MASVRVAGRTPRDSVTMRGQPIVYAFTVPTRRAASPRSRQVHGVSRVAGREAGDAWREARRARSVRGGGNGAPAGLGIGDGGNGRRATGVEGGPPSGCSLLVRAASRRFPLFNRRPSPVPRPRATSREPQRRSARRQPRTRPRRARSPTARPARTPSAARGRHRDRGGSKAC